MQLLCNGDITRPIKVEVLDWSRNGKHELIGFITTSIEELSLKSTGLTFTLLNPAVQGLLFFFTFSPSAHRVVP